jgi:hypothetical protein
MVERELSWEGVGGRKKCESSGGKRCFLMLLEV